MKNSGVTYIFIHNYVNKHSTILDGNFDIPGLSAVSEKTIWFEEDRKSNWCERVIKQFLTANINACWLPLSKPQWNIEISLHRTLGFWQLEIIYLCMTSALSISFSFLRPPSLPFLSVCLSVEKQTKKWWQCKVVAFMRWSSFCSHCK